MPAATPCICEYSVTCSQLWTTTRYDEQENFFHTIPSDRGQSSLKLFETASLGPPILALFCGVNLYVFLMCGKIFVVPRATEPGAQPGAQPRVEGSCLLSLHMRSNRHCYRC